jgi:hypothetical protein
LEPHLRKEQVGFRKGQNFIDLINTLRIISEQSNEWKGTHCLALVHLEKVSDLLPRDVIWQVLEEYKIPKKIVNIIKGLI